LNDGEGQNVEEKVYLVRDIATTKDLSQGHKCLMIISGFIALVILVLTVAGVTFNRNHNHRVWRLILLVGSIGTSIALTVLMKAAKRTLSEIITLVILFWTVFPKQMEGLVSDVNPGRVYG
jgi:drug/metabolite transporter (DMT)-like permease